MIKRRIFPGIAVLIALLCFVCVSGVPALAADEAEPEEQGDAVAATVLPSSESYIADLTTADVVVDLYLVADAERVPGADTYRYELGEAYASLALRDDLNSTEWQALADAAADIALAGESPVVRGGATGEGTKLSESDDGQALRPGLYLIIAHSRDLRTVADYRLELTETVVDEETGVSRRETYAATLAHSERFDYQFRAELVALPSRLDAGPGDAFAEWIAEPTVTLKPARTPRMGDIAIIKTLDDYAGGEPATFVFEIEADWEDPDTHAVSRVFSDVVAMSFTAAGTKTKLIEGRIPIASNVTVTEVYSGARYALTGGAPSQRLTVRVDATQSVMFTNAWDETVTGGHGIVNYYEYDGNGWQVEQRARENAEN